MDYDDWRDEPSLLLLHLKLAWHHIKKALEVVKYMVLPSPTASEDRLESQRGDGRTTDGRSEKS